MCKLDIFSDISVLCSGTLLQRTREKESPNEQAERAAQVASQEAEIRVFASGQAGEVEAVQQEVILVGRAQADTDQVVPFQSQAARVPDLEQGGGNRESDHGNGGTRQKAL